MSITIAWIYGWQNEGERIFYYNNFILKYSSTEIVETPEHIKHPILKCAVLKTNLSGIDLASFSDIPSGTGLGSSSAFTVGVLNALKSFKNEKFTQLELAKEAQEIEITDLNGNKEKTIAKYYLP